MTKLTDKQRDHLWNTLRGCGCSEEWLMYHGEYLCENIAALIERPQITNVVEQPRVIHHYSPPPPSDFGVGLAIGLATGSMFG